jgi:lipopolysaccharide/colanic/teichoic acid biosynthesis glycosyltransferase
MIYAGIKRFFDILCSLIAIVICAPVLLPIMLLCRLTGEGEVFYFQKRMGFKNQQFDIWKFATMLKNSPNMGTGDITLRKDPRITPMGHFLRRSKINELPQLVNILKGDMSFVGPRPLMPVSFQHYTPDVQAVIYNKKPGLTGIGSIIFRDEEKWVSESNLNPQEFYIKHIFPHKAEVELWYQKNAAFGTDFKIMLLTGCSIILPNNQFLDSAFPDLPTRKF